MSDYRRFIEDAVATNFDYVARRPWRFDRVERAWQLKTAALGAEAHGVPADRVYQDLREAITRRTRNLLWLIPSLPALVFVLFQMIRGWVVWRAYAGWLGAGYAGRAGTAPGAVGRSIPPAGSRDESPVATIVILSCNRQPYLETTIESLYATADSNRFELVVVDNGSTDGSADYLCGLAKSDAVDKVILRERNHGTSPGFNVGFAHADPRSRLLVKLDSDIVLLDSGWLERLERFREVRDEISRRLTTL